MWPPTPFGRARAPFGIRQVGSEWCNFEPQSQFEPLCRNCVILYVSFTIWVEYKVSLIYFVNNQFSLFSHKYSDRCTLAPPSTHISLITTLSNNHTLCPTSMMMATMDPHSVPPQWWWIPWIHDIYHLNDYGSHGSTICLPSIIMDPMDPHYAPPQLWCITWLPPICNPLMMMDTYWWRRCGEGINSSPWIEWRIFPMQKFMTEG